MGVVGTLFPKEEVSRRTCFPWHVHRHTLKDEVYYFIPSESAPLFLPSTSPLQKIRVKNTLNFLENNSRFPMVLSIYSNNPIPFSLLGVYFELLYGWKSGDNLVSNLTNTIREILFSMGALQC